MSLKDQFIDRFGLRMFGGETSPDFSSSSLRFELGVGDDALNYKIAALHRLNGVLDALGFKDHDVGIAAFCYVHEPHEFSPPKSNQRQILPFARDIAQWGGIEFCRSEFALVQRDIDRHVPEDITSVAVHFGKCRINKGLLSSWLIRHLIRDFGGSEVPLLMLFDVELGVVVNPYDDRGMDVFGPNHEVLSKLYHGFNDWLLDYDRKRMKGVYEK